MSQTVKLTVTDQSGQTQEIEGIANEPVMYAIRDTGLPIKAACGGNCSCATCHVYVDPAWTDKAGPPHDDEEALLDTAFNVEPNSRLSCQITLGPELDGLSVTLAPGTEPE